MSMIRNKNRSIGVIDHEKANGDVFEPLQGDQDQGRVKHEHMMQSADRHLLSALPQFDDPVSHPSGRMHPR